MDIPEKLKGTLMPPQWLMYPNIPEGSIGWRMGYGEYYTMAFDTWFSGLSKEEQEQYRRKFPQPICWNLEEDNLLRHEQFWIYKWQSRTGYDIKYIKNERKHGTHREQISFWGHQPNVEGMIDKSCLSQWYKAKFQIGVERYSCMEQYMMAQKARLFGDEETLKKIMDAEEQSVMKQLGREVKQFKSKVWNEYKLPIVMTGNYYKFAQIPELRHYLLGTGDALLVEASPFDTIWGIGLGENDRNVNEPKAWKGRNLLGFALMEVRDELKRLWKYENEIDFESFLPECRN